MDMAGHTQQSEGVVGEDGAESRGGGVDFVRAIVAEDMRQNTYGGRVLTRFPPEPNGYLHIGHAKSICLNFGVAEEFDGECNLRFDDTNPETEDMHYVEAMQRDIRWLGYDLGDRVFFASDYYEQLYSYAERLILDGKAYVDSLNEAEIREFRGTVTEPGRASPYRGRSVEENMDLFKRMRAGEFSDGTHVLRARIDMAAPNMKMRDPLLYRIRHADHYRTGSEWCIYPMYDFAHPLSDAIEGITHSLCSLEFENNREIYDWVLANLQPPPRSRQYEFARLFLDYTVMSKRKLLQLVDEGYVDGWDDPRMPTIAGLRRRGVTPEAIRAFSDRVGVAKTNSRVDISLLEHCIRDNLNYQAPRVLCVLRPLKVVILNYPADQTEVFDAPYWPRDVPKEGARKVPFSREIYIERDDFMEDPPKGFRRMAPGREIRLRYAYIVRCVDVVRDAASNEIVEVHCTYDPETKGGAAPKGRKVHGTIHWVSALHAVPAEIRLYDRLFYDSNPDDVEEGKTFKEYLNPDSLEILPNCRVEPSIVDDPPGTRYQFERQGYFISDAVDSAPGALVYNRIIELRDSWARFSTKQPGARSPAREDQAEPDAENGEPRREGESRRSRTEVRDEIRADTPKLAERFQRYSDELALPVEDADVLSGDLTLSDFFEAALSVHDSPQTVAKWMTNEVLRELKDKPIDSLAFSGERLGALVALVDQGTISSTIGKEVFAEMVATGEDPNEIVRNRGLEQVADPAVLEPIIDLVVAANAEKAEEYRAGKSGLLGFFIGQVMRETKGKADPKLVQELLQAKLI